MLSNRFDVNIHYDSKSNFNSIWVIPGKYKNVHNLNAYKCCKNHERGASRHKPKNYTTPNVIICLVVFKLFSLTANLTLVMIMEKGSWQNMAPICNRMKIFPIESGKKLIFLIKKFPWGEKLLRIRENIDKNIDFRSINTFILLFAFIDGYTFHFMYKRQGKI